MNLFIRLLYSLVLTVLAPFLLYTLLKKQDNKPSIGKRWSEYFGISSQMNIEGRPIWVHAVSVGEVIAAAPFIRELKKQHPDKVILLTTTTTTGAQQAKSLLPEIEHRYMPIDFSFAVKKFINNFKPSKLLIIETELWPNTLHTVARHNIPISIVNARLSEKSFKGYKRALPLFRIIEEKLTQIICQYQDDANRFHLLGVSESKLHVVGSIKFDISVTSNITDLGNNLRKDLGVNRPIWIASSTHEGEDELILEAHAKLLQTLPKSLLIIVPRHPERFDAVYNLSRSLGFSTQRRTKNTMGNTPSCQVYLGDTMGEMMQLIQASDICFMGGSLLGHKVGGHNMLEPAVLNKPVISGPSYFNFSEIANLLLANNGLKIIDGCDELSDQLLYLWQNKDAYMRMTEGASYTISQNKGSIGKTIQLIA